MTKAKKKTATKKSAAKKPAASVGGFVVGSRVRVKAGEWGNSRGTVSGADGVGGVLVQLDNTPRSGPTAFDCSELQAL